MIILKITATRLRATYLLFYKDFINKFKVKMLYKIIHSNIHTIIIEFELNSIPIKTPMVVILNEGIYGVKSVLIMTIMFTNIRTILYVKTER